MGREENVTIFLDTQQQVKTNPALAAAVKKQTKEQKLILEKDSYPRGKKGQEAAADGAQADAGAPKVPEGAAKAQVKVSKKRTYEAASFYKGKKTCVLNFASASNPGGGVVRGSTAQEECLCRCSTLYFSLNTQPMWDGFYSPHRQSGDPIHNDDIIYTPGVCVFKTDTAQPKMMPEKDWYSVDVITCAAPNLRKRPGNQMNAGDGNIQAKVTDKELLALHEKRLARILDVAAGEGNEVVILGAFGCGAFANKPEVVAQAAKNVIQNYLHVFETIEFAVYCSPGDDTNYTVFERVLKNM